MIQKSYVERVLSRFNMQNLKLVSTPFSIGCKLSSKQCPSNDSDLEVMSQVSYSSAVGSLIFYGGVY